MKCSSCKRRIHPKVSFSAFNEFYCDDCFSDIFIICPTCDKIEYRSECNIDPLTKQAYCSGCYIDEDIVDKIITGKEEL